MTTSLHRTGLFSKTLPADGWVNTVVLGGISRIHCVASVFNVVTAVHEFINIL